MAMKAALRMPLTMLGITIRVMTVVQLAPSDRPASARVVTSMAWRAESIER